MTKRTGSGAGFGEGCRAGFGSVSQRYGFADPDPYQKFTDPQHSKKKVYSTEEKMR